MVPVVIANALRSAILRLSGTSVARFAGTITPRLGVTVAGSTTQMANQLARYIANNPMSAGLVAASLAASTVDFNIDSFVDAWDNEGGMPEDVRELLKQIGNNVEKRNETVGDGEPDTTFGVDNIDLRKAAAILAHGDRQIEVLINAFGNIDDVISIRNALFGVEDEQLALYKERHSVNRY